MLLQTLKLFITSMILQLTTSTNVASQRNGDIIFLAFKAKTKNFILKSF